MRYLIKLDLSNNNIVNLLDFEPHPYNLQEIDFSRNKIVKIDNLSNQRFLKKVCLDSKFLYISSSSNHHHHYHHYHIYIHIPY